MRVIDHELLPSQGSQITSGDGGGRRVDSAGTSGSAPGVRGALASRRFTELVCLGLELEGDSK